MYAATIAARPQLDIAQHRILIAKLKLIRTAPARQRRAGSSCHRWNRSQAVRGVDRREGIGICVALTWRHSSVPRERRLANRNRRLTKAAARDPAQQGNGGSRTLGRDALSGPPDSARALPIVPRETASRKLSFQLRCRVGIGTGTCLRNGSIPRFCWPRRSRRVGRPPGSRRLFRIRRQFPHRSTRGAYRQGGRFPCSFDRRFGTLPCEVVWGQLLTGRVLHPRRTRNGPIRDPGWGVRGRRIRSYRLRHARGLPFALHPGRPCRSGKRLREGHRHLSGKQRIDPAPSRQANRNLQARAFRLSERVRRLTDRLAHAPRQHRCKDFFCRTAAALDSRNSFSVRRIRLLPRRQIARLRFTRLRGRSGCGGAGAVAPQRRTLRSGWVF